MFDAIQAVFEMPKEAMMTEGFESELASVTHEYSATSLRNSISVWRYIKEMLKSFHVR